MTRESGLVALHPGAAEVSRRLARLRKSDLRGDRERAELRQLEREVNARAGQPAARYQLAQLLARAGLHARALQQTSAALQERPQPTLKARLWTLQGRVLLARGNLRQSLRSLERAYELNPGLTAPHLIRAMERAVATLDQEGQGATAQRAVMRLAQLYRSHGSASAAAVLLASWTQRHGPDARLLHALAHVYGELDRPRYRAEALLQLMRVSRGELQLRAALELSALDDEHVDGEALGRALEAAYRAQPEHAGLRELLREHYARRGARHSLARMAAEDARRTRPPGERADQLVRAASALSRCADTRGARELLYEALRLRPGHADAACLLGELLLGQDELAAARACLDRTCQRPMSTRDASRIDHVRARVEQRAGNLDEAVRLLQRSRARWQENPEVLVDLARVALKRHDFRLADQTLAALLTERRPCSMKRWQIQLARGNLALHRGNPAQARVWLRRAERSGASAEGAASLRAAIERRTR